MRDDNTEEAQTPHFLGYPRWEWIFALILGAIFFCVLMWQGKIVLFWLIAALIILFLLAAVGCCVKLLSAILAK